MSTLKILLVAANPTGTSVLLLDEEIRKQNITISRTEHRERLQLVPCLASRPDDLMQAMLEHKPDIIQFSGHATEDNEIIMLDDNRLPKPVSATALLSLFKALKDNVKVVFLNACFTHVQAKAIASEIDFTIGMAKSVDDESAAVFAAAFYRGLGFGRSVRQSFELGTSAIQMEGTPDSDAPVLWVRSGADEHRNLVEMQSASATGSGVSLIDASLDEKDSRYRYSERDGTISFQAKSKET